jgi:CrcB protein
MPDVDDPDAVVGGPGARRLAPDVLVAIAIGGAIGTLARYEVTQHIHVAKDTFPWTTFLENVSGAFGLGLFLTVGGGRFFRARMARAFVAIGFLGGFTTFSTLAVETVVLVKDHYAALGIGYLLASVAAGLVACALGVMAARIPRVLDARAQH